jgi:hypothetical protein
LKKKELIAAWIGHSRNHKNEGLTLNVDENKKDIDFMQLKFTSKTLSFHEKPAFLATNLECL